MKSYEALARYYDKLILDNRSINGWIRFTEGNLKEKNILELACGSGAITEKLIRKGYSILATDLSEQMLQKAREKLGSDAELMKLDMSDFELSKSFDGVICYNDSINYLTDTDQLESCFRCVNRVLNKGGKFLFDIHHIGRAQEFADEFIEEGIIDDTPYQWTIVCEDDMLYHHLVFYSSEGMLEEEHVQRIYSKDEVKKCLAKCGFDYSVYTDFDKNEEEKGEKYYFVAVKR